MLFIGLLSKVERPLRVLDVGGSYDYWRNIDTTVLGKVQIVLLNVFPQPDLPAPCSSTTP